MLGTRTILAVIDEWVHHPEFYIFDVGFLEVVLVELSHHTTPSVVLVLILKSTIFVKIGIEVVRTTLLWIVCKVEDIQGCCCTTICALATVRIQLADIYLTNIVVRQLLKVILDVSRGQGRGATSEERVNIIPCKTCSMLT